MSVYPIVLLLNQDLKFKSMTDLTSKEAERCKPLYDASNEDFTVVFKSTHSDLVDCLVGKTLLFKTNVLGEKIVETEHWNYYPGRKEMSLTHTSTTKESEFLGVQNHLEATVASTFKSLLRLLS